VSVEAITWAIEQPIESSPAKFVLVVLANCGWLAFPSVAYMTQTTGQDRKTVLRNIRRLIDWGLIEDTGERRGATKQIPVYKLRGYDLFLSKQAQKRTGPKKGTVPKTAANGPKKIPKQAQKRDTEPLEPLLTKSGAIVREKRKSGAPSRPMLELFKQIGLTTKEATP